MNNDLQSGSRSGQRAKRKKTNLILNSLIVLVIALIVFVAYTIFSSGNDKASSKNDVHKTVEKSSSHKVKNDTSKESSTSGNDSSSTDKNTEGQQSEEAATSSETDDSQNVVTEGGSSSNVDKTTENPDWKPAGTSQTGEHTPVYDTSSTDWQEMLNAISSATGLDKSNMTVWFLGRDKTTENASVGTVSSKDKQQKYKVYIQWVDGQGWKPTKVEQLSEIGNGNGN